jgi:hypothetical protein
MRRTLLAAGAWLTCAIAPALAGPTVLSWLHEANHRVDVTLLSAGVTPGGRDIDLRMRVDRGGHLYAPQLLTPTGSARYDAQITSAARRIEVAAPPTWLPGRAVVFHLHIAEPGR